MSDGSDCFLCNPGHRPIIAHNELAFALNDAHPVTPLHALIIPRRHAATYFDLHEPEQRAINLILDQVRLKVLAADTSVQGFNIGMNCGNGGSDHHALPCPSDPAPAGGCRSAPRRCSCGHPRQGGVLKTPTWPARTAR